MAFFKLGREQERFIRNASILIASGLVIFGYFHITQQSALQETTPANPAAQELPDTKSSKRTGVTNPENSGLTKFNGDVRDIVNFPSSLDSNSYGRVATPDGQILLVKATDGTWYVANTNNVGGNNGSTYEYGQTVDVKVPETNNKTSVFATLRRGPNTINGKPETQVIFATKENPTEFYYGFTVMDYAKGISDQEDFETKANGLKDSLPRRPKQDRRMLGQ